MTRPAVIFLSLLLPLLGLAQGGDQQLRAKADALFDEQRFAEAYPLYSQLVSLTPGDRDLNYRFGTCTLFGNEDKEAAIGHLKFATESPATPPMAWYWLGRAYHLNYRFKEAQVAYQRFLGTGDKKAIAAWPVEALDKQCRNGEQLLSSLKEITVRNRTEVDDTEFFRFYDLSDIGGKIVVLPDELKTSVDKKRKLQSLIYLPGKGGPIYFSSYGRDDATGRDIYRTELLPDGTFAIPVKLAGYINTDQDEDYAFMHPDGRTFYFSSKGHNSMGGFDVFKATYDRGLDAFGRPENLDFAVNTPDDDIFYMVDGEQKEACFASGRNSKQGKLHVYRVATAQQPVVITVFKGTYASTFDEKDRRAHIIVEDAITRERVADVRTDMNGNYVLSVPRPGSFRYQVECGPSGRTHTGVVDVPKRDGPRAFRQELVLEPSGDLEKLVIRNYFETPLEDDLVALSLDEIKRRARLDITQNEPVMQEQVEEPAAPTGDVMTRAGFTGDIDQAAAVALAKEDAAELSSNAADLDASSKEAFAIAVEAVVEADRAANEAADLVAQASAETDEDRKNELMVDAARKRQRSREANLRARAALHTGQDLDASSLAKQQEAITADRLSTDVAAAVAKGNDENTLPLLRKLRERLDVAQGPASEADAAERARRAVTEQEKAVQRAMSVANAKRADENELTDRVARLKREQEETRSRARKDELQREITVLDEQLGHLRNETKAAFDQAAVLEKETATLRGQASLTRHLTTNATHGVGTELTQAQLDQLGQRIANTDERIAAIAIDERFDAQIASTPSEVEARTFDWDLADNASGTNNDPSATQVADRSTTNDAQRTAGRTTTVEGSTNDHATETATIGVVPSTVEEVGANTTATEEVVAAPNTAQDPPANSGSTTSELVEPTIARATNEEPTSNDHFLLENERAELVQLAQAERNKTRRDSLNQRIAGIDAQLAQDVSTESTQQGSDVETDIADPAEVDMTRPVLAFTAKTKDTDIVAQLYADYKADSARVQQLTDADERASGAHGLELMLADSIKAEMTRQVAVLQLSPQQAEVVLPRMDRLRRLREEHMAAGEEAIAARQREVAGLAPTNVADINTEQHTPTARQAAAVDMINDRFVALDRYAENVYASKIEHRSTAKGVADAIAFKEADVARMDEITSEVDSLEEVIEEMPVGKEREKLRKNTDMLIDERMIIRTDMGQRSAFLTKEEWRTANDSMAVTSKEVARLGIAPDEPLMLMAQGMQADAKRSFDQATQMRKRADRIDEILERDSLYREAYRQELSALRELDRAITVNNYLIGEDHKRGETLAYEVVASKVLDIPLTAPEEPLLATAAGAPGEPVEEEPEVPAPTEPAVAINTEAAPTTTTQQPIATEGSARMDAAAPDGVVNEGANTDVQGTSNTAVEVAATRTAGNVGNDGVVVPTQESAAAVQEQILQVEQRLQPKDRMPAQLYESFLASEGAILPEITQDPEMEPRLLGRRAEQASKEASAMERRSVDLSDQATLLADSATKAKRRDREELEQLAARTRALSDSLHNASMAKTEEAQVALQQQREAEQAKVYRDRLVKFYYLTSEEQLLVMEDEDQSRYFQAKTRALEQFEAADDAANAAKSNREVGRILQEQARAAEQLATSGQMPAAEAAARASLLDARAADALVRADSLDNVAARLRGAAGINENQAGVMLQAMPAENSSELMALEMRTRRTEALLAEAHDQAGRQQPNAAGAPTANTVGVQGGSSTENNTSAPGVEQRVEQATSMQPVEIASATNATADPVVPTRAAAGVDPLATRTASPVATGAIPDVLASDRFEMLPATERRDAAIPMDAPMPAGIVFKVQIGAFRKPVPVEAFSDMTPVMGETVGNGLVRYTAGLFTGFDHAAAAKEQVRDRGYRDAFVVAYRDGKRIPLGEAMRAERVNTSLAQGTTPAQPVPATERPAATIQAPAPVIINAEPDVATVLAKYPATAEEVIASFVPAADATAYYNEPGAAPARQVETVKGLFFTVQVGVYSKPVPLGRIFNLNPLNSERTETAKVRYTTGVFLDQEKARIRKDETVVLGVKDAFVTAYLNGKRIPMREANALLQKFGPAILAKP